MVVLKDCDDLGNSRHGEAVGNTLDRGRFLRVVSINMALAVADHTPRR